MFYHFLDYFEQKKVCWLPKDHVDHINYSTHPTPICRTGSSFELPNHSFPLKMGVYILKTSQKCLFLCSWIFNFKAYKTHISWIVMAVDPYNPHEKNMFSTEDPGNPSWFQLRSSPRPPQCGRGGVGCGTAGAGGAGGGTHEALDAVRHRSHGAAGHGHGRLDWWIGLMDLDSIRCTMQTLCKQKGVDGSRDLTDLMLLNTVDIEPWFPWAFSRIPKDFERYYSCFEDRRILPSWH